MVAGERNLCFHFLVFIQKCAWGPGGAGVCYYQTWRVVGMGCPKAKRMHGPLGAIPHALEMTEVQPLSQGLSECLQLSLDVILLL